MGNTNRLILIALASLTLLGILPNTTLLVLLKLLAGAAAVIYFIFLNNGEAADVPEAAASPAEKDTRGLPAAERPADNEAPQHISTSQKVDDHFDRFLTTLFPLIKQTLVAKTAVLLMVNYERQQFFLRHVMSDHTGALIDEAFLDLHGGLPGLIFKKKDMLIEHQLPDSDNLLPYYAGRQKLPARSFVGVPLMFDHILVGILCVDSDVEGSFSRDDGEILSAYADLLSIQLALSNKLYDYETENWTTRLLYDFSKKINDIETRAELWNYLSTALTAAFGAERVLVCEKGEQESKVVYCQELAPAIAPDETFSNEAGIIGWVLRKNQPLVVQDFAAKDNYIPRLSANEKQVNEYRSLLAVPVGDRDGAKMVISVESVKAGHYTDQHKKIMQTLAYQVAAFLKRQRVVENLQQHNLVDSGTRLGNYKALFLDINKEVARAKSFDNHFCLQFIEPGLPEDSARDASLENLNRELIAFLQHHLPPTAYLYRFDEQKFALLWPERQKEPVIAAFQELLKKNEQKRGWANGHIEQLFLRSGLVEFPRMATHTGDLINHAQSALESAHRKGHNHLAVYGDSDSGATDAHPA